MVQPSAMTVDVGDGGACHSHQHWGCKEKKKLTFWVGIDMLDQGYRLTSIIAGAVVDVGGGGCASCFIAVDDAGGRGRFHPWH